MSVTPGFEDWVVSTTMSFYAPRKCGKRRPGVGKRQQRAYIRIRNLRNAAELEAQIRR